MNLITTAALYVLTLCSPELGALFTAVSFVGLAFSLIGGLALRMLMWIVGAGFLSLFDLAREHRSVILNQ